MERRVLIVDDDEGVRLTVQHILITIGCEACSASNCAEARQAFGKFSPSIVITDLIMPEEEGTTFIRDLKELSPDTKIVAMSGGARLGDARILERAREAGADRLLSKPFTSAALAGLVGELLALQCAPQSVNQIDRAP